MKSPASRRIGAMRAKDRWAIGTLVERSSRFTVLLHLPPAADRGAARIKNGPPVTGAGEQVVGDADARHANRRGHVLLGDQSRQAGPAHQPLDALAANALTVLDDQIRPDPRRAVDLAALRVQHGDRALRRVSAMARGLSGRAAQA